MDTNCIVCDRKPAWQWTDTHGIAQCIWCGTPYRIYHYEGDKRIDKPAECMVRPEWLPLLRRYRDDTRHKIPGGFSFSPDYEVAQPDDFNAFKKWCDEHGSEIPADSTDR